VTQHARLDADDVRAALGAEMLIDRYGVKGRRSGREFRTKLCPACGPRAREAVAINLPTGLWHDHARGCSGDVLDLLAGLAGINRERQFPALLELAAAIAGVLPTVTDDAKRAHRRAEQLARAERRRAAEQAETAARRAHAIGSATARWKALAPRSVAGERYLVERGVLGVLGLGLVRFTDAGDVAIALHTADGFIVNVARRRIDGREPKVLGMAGCPTAGTFVNSIADITHDRDVVLVEGLFDALTARLAWPRAVVLGAHGGGNVPRIAAAAARRIALARARLLLVPHDDEAGERTMIAAGRAALAAGLAMGSTLDVIDCGSKDLNDAWLAGWGRV
jgi:hypothetical protein